MFKLLLQSPQGPETYSFLERKSKEELMNMLDLLRQQNEPVEGNKDILTRVVAYQLAITTPQKDKKTFEVALNIVHHDVKLDIHAGDLTRDQFEKGQYHTEFDSLKNKLVIYPFYYSNYFELISNVQTEFFSKYTSESPEPQLEVQADDYVQFLPHFIMMGRLYNSILSRSPTEISAISKKLTPGDFTLGMLDAIKILVDRDFQEGASGEDDSCLSTLHDIFSYSLGTEECRRYLESLPLILNDSDQSTRKMTHSKISIGSKNPEDMTLDQITLLIRSTDKLNDPEDAKRIAQAYENNSPFALNIKNFFHFMYSIDDNEKAILFKNALFGSSFNIEDIVENNLDDILFSVRYLKRFEELEFLNRQKINLMMEKYLNGLNLKGKKISEIEHIVNLSRLEIFKEIGFGTRLEETLARQLSGSEPVISSHDDLRRFLKVLHIFFPGTIDEKCGYISKYISVYSDNPEKLKSLDEYIEIKPFFIQYYKNTIHSAADLKKSMTAFPYNSDTQKGVRYFSPRDLIGSIAPMLEKIIDSTDKLIELTSVKQFNEFKDAIFDALSEELLTELIPDFDAFIKIQRSNRNAKHMLPLLTRAMNQDYMRYLETRASKDKVDSERFYQCLDFMSNQTLESIINGDNTFLYILVGGNAQLLRILCKSEGLLSSPKFMRLILSKIKNMEELKDFISRCEQSSNIPREIIMKNLGYFESFVFNFEDFKLLYSKIKNYGKDRFGTSRDSKTIFLASLGHKLPRIIVNVKDLITALQMSKIDEKWNNNNYVVTVKKNTSAMDSLLVIMADYIPNFVKNYKDFLSLCIAMSGLAASGIVLDKFFGQDFEKIITTYHELKVFIGTCKKMPPENLSNIIMKIIHKRSAVFLDDDSQFDTIYPYITDKLRLSHELVSSYHEFHHLTRLAKCALDPNLIEPHDSLVDKPLSNKYLKIVEEVERLKWSLFKPQMPNMNSQEYWMKDPSVLAATPRMISEEMARVREACTSETLSSLIGPDTDFRQVFDIVCSEETEPRKIESLREAGVVLDDVDSTRVASVTPPHSEISKLRKKAEDSVAAQSKKRKATLSKLLRFHERHANVEDHDDSVDPKPRQSKLN